jgi:hypothetical protein
LADFLSASDGVNKTLITGESTKQPVKTIARGMSGETDVTVVTMLVCFFILHARLRVRRAPGIPCALWLEQGNSGKPRVHRTARMRNCIHVIARSESDEAIHSLFARPDGNISEQARLWRVFSCSARAFTLTPSAP